jgi:ribosomal protein S18 acetylase RimI-like enzyme
VNKSLLIKKAKTEDAKAVWQITNKAFKKYVKDAGILGRVDALKESLEDIINEINKKEVLVAFFDNIPVGAIRVEFINNETALITRFGVMPEHQNNGIGRAMIDYVDNLLKSKSIKKVSLYTASKHKELVRFYYSMGFYIDSTTKDRGYIRALMVKEYTI